MEKYLKVVNRIRESLNLSSDDIIITGSLALYYQGFKYDHEPVTPDGTLTVDWHPNDLDLIIKLTDSVKASSKMLRLINQANNPYKNADAPRCSMTIDGVKVDLWVVPELPSSVQVTVNKVQYNLRPMIDIIKKKMEYGRPKDKKFLKSFLSQVL